VPLGVASGALERRGAPVVDQIPPPSRSTAWRGVDCALAAKWIRPRALLKPIVREGGRTARAGLLEAGGGVG
jgi:hypothetical protein